jgi:DNA-binding LytR/AlgR family response regulator
MKNEEIQLSCMLVDDDELSRSMLKQLIKKTEYLQLLHTCESAIEAHNILDKDDKGIDILFLDIEMPEMTGIDLLKTLQNKKINIILTTSREQYAVEAFEYNVTDYLVKPISYPRFLKAITKVREKMEHEAGSFSVDLPYLFVRSNHKIVKIEPNEIDFIEALSDYILIHTSKQKYVVHSTMKGIEEKLIPFKRFVRVHRSYIVNMNHVEVVQDIHVIVRGKTIPIGRSYRPKFIEGLDIL